MSDVAVLARGVRALRDHRGPTVVLDATGDAPFLRAALGKEVEDVPVEVEGVLRVPRIAMFSPNGSRARAKRGAFFYGNATEDLGRAAGWLDFLGVEKFLLITHQPLFTLLQEAWTTFTNTGFVESGRSISRRD